MKGFMFGRTEVWAMDGSVMSVDYGDMAAT